MSTPAMEVPDNHKEDVTCTVCVTSSVIAVILTIMGTGIAYIVESAQLGQIGYPYQLWYWSLFYNILMFLGIVDLIGKACLSIFPDWTCTSIVFGSRYWKVLNYLELPICSMIIGMFVWAIVIMAGLGVTSQLYSRHLWIWFQVLFWYQVFAFTMATLLIGGMYINRRFCPRAPQQITTP